MKILKEFCLIIPKFNILKNKKKVIRKKKLSIYKLFFYSLSRAKNFYNNFFPNKYVNKNIFYKKYFIKKLTKKLIIFKLSSLYLNKLYFNIKINFDYKNLLSKFIKNKFIYSIIFHVKQNQFVIKNTLILTFRIKINIYSKYIIKVKKKKLFSKINQYSFYNKLDFFNFYIEEYDNFLNIKNKEKNIYLNSNLSFNLKSNIIGYFLNNLNSTVLFRKFKIYLFSKNVELKYFNNEFIENNKNLAILFFETLQSSDIVQGLPKVNKLLELFSSNNLFSFKTILLYKKNLFFSLNTIYLNQNVFVKKNIIFYLVNKKYSFFQLGKYFERKNIPKNIRKLLICYFNFFSKRKGLEKAVISSFIRTNYYILKLLDKIYLKNGVYIASQNFEVVLKQLSRKVKIKLFSNVPFYKNELIDLFQINLINQYLYSINKKIIYFEPYIYGLTKASMLVTSLLAKASTRETSKILIKGSIEGKLDLFKGLKENLMFGNFPELISYNKLEESLSKLSNLKILKKPIYDK